MLIKLSLKRLNLTSSIKHRTGKATFALVAGTLLTTAALSGCGKRKPPLPPVERVSQVVVASGFQRGDQILLSWKMPARNAEPGSVLNVARADIYRVAEPLTAPLTLSEEEFASKSMIIGSVPIADTDFGLKTVTYADTLQFASQPVRLRYSVRLVNSQGQRAGFSNFFLIEPTGKVSSKPVKLSVQVTQGSLDLRWQAPTTNSDGTTPVNLLGYNVYRSESDSEAARRLTDTPINVTEYEDRFFDFNTQYYYFVRAVSSGTGGEPLESGESNIVSVEPKDTFPPTPPAAITLAVSRNSIALFFAVNPENDVVGYRIYRSEDASLDKAEWNVLTPELLETNSFQDLEIESGKRYFYYLTAVDKRGNVSDPSEVVSETAP